MRSSADLQTELIAVSIQETSLGWEFFADDGLRGFVTGPDAEDTVEAIGAADICAFR